MPYTLAEAAVACGLDKSTVRRAVRSGRISGTRDEFGVWHVEPAELHRVFPPAVRTDGDTTAVPRDAPPETATITTDALVAELRAVIADLRQDRDHWREAFQTAQRQLPPPVYQYATDEQVSATVLPATPEQPSRLRRAWRWMRTTGCLAGVGLLLALMSGGAGAQQQRNPDSANNMLPPCKRALDMAQRTPGVHADFPMGFCAGSIFSLAWVGPSLSSTLRFCPPKEATRPQMIRVVIAYVEARPARMHEDFRVLALEALHEAWPC